jgi:NhaP-type Na+/H+ or K+/H+ antiporter
MLTPKEQRQLKKYEEDIAIPRWKYILMYGIPWGVITPVLITLFELTFGGKSLQQQWREHLWTRFLIFPVMGIFMGLFMRWMMAKQLAKLRKKEKQTNQETFPSNQE